MVNVQDIVKPYEVARRDIAKALPGLSGGEVNLALALAEYESGMMSYVASNYTLSNPERDDYLSTAREHFRHQDERALAAGDFIGAHQGSMNDDGLIAPILDISRGRSWRDILSASRAKVDEILEFVGHLDVSHSDFFRGHRIVCNRYVHQMQLLLIHGGGRDEIGERLLLLENNPFYRSNDDYREGVAGELADIKAQLGLI